MQYALPCTPYPLLPPIPMEVLRHEEGWVVSGRAWDACYFGEHGVVRVLGGDEPLFVSLRNF